MIPESGRGDSGVVLFIMSIHRGECNSLYLSLPLLLSLSHTLSLIPSLFLPFCHSLILTLYLSLSLSLSLFLSLSVSLSLSLSLSDYLSKMEEISRSNEELSTHAQYLEQDVLLMKVRISIYYLLSFFYLLLHLYFLIFSQSLFIFVFISHTSLSLSHLPFYTILNVRSLT